MQILGIYFDKPFLRVALIEKGRKRTEILYLKCFSIDELENVKQLYNGTFTGKICSALSAKNFLVRPLEIKTCSPRHLEQIISFQSDAITHLPQSEILSVPHILNKGKEKTDLLLFTATRNAIAEHLQEWEKYKLDPDCVTTTPLALIRFVKWKNPDLQDVFIVDLSSQEWTCVYMEKGALKKVHFVDGGVEALLGELWKDRKNILFPKEVKGVAKQIDLLQLKTSLNLHLSTKLNAMKQDLAKIIYSFFSQSGPKPIIFTGRVDAFGQMREYLMEAVKESVSHQISILPKEEEKYAVPIGLSLEYGPESLQFRKQEFFPKKHWKRAGVYSLYLLFASFCISAALIGVSHYTVDARKQEMISYLRNYLNRWDPSLLSSIFSHPNEEEILRKWNQVVSSNAKDLPYLMQSPKVAEILSWLYQHPVLLESGLEKNPIEIKFLRYQLVQYPKIDSPREPYQAKVEIEFKTKSALVARKFHENLLQDNTFVDNSQEVQWEALENMYRVSFFIKKEKQNAS